MQVLAVRPSTTIAVMKDVNKSSRQTLFPVVDSNEKYLGLLYLRLHVLSVFIQFHFINSFDLLDSIVPSFFSFIFPFFIGKLYI